MKKLGIRNITLLCMGAKTTGTFTEAYSYVEEELYCDEANIILHFCEWVDKTIGGGGERNLEILFEAFMNPKNEEAMKFAMDLKHKIAEIRGRIGL